ncbi:MAG: superoxide dismutase family protein [Xanthomonadales bacterium]|nr:superoxide dismutase family protein [Xanthomonadales bacterium]
MRIPLRCLLAASALAASAFVHADTTVQMHKVNADGVAESIGTVVISESKYGTVFTPSLHGLSPGLHGFHVHEHPSCDAEMKDGKAAAAMAAGGHLDPHKAGRHGTPWGTGHLGDLPALYVDDQGRANTPVLAPRLKLADVKNHALMIHAGGDNYSDQPEPLGGGGARVACGAIK